MLDLRKLIFKFCLQAISLGGVVGVHAHEVHFTAETEIPIKVTLPDDTTALSDGLHVLGFGVPFTKGMIQEKSLDGMC